MINLSDFLFCCSFVLNVSELSTKFQYTQENNSSAKQEAVQLREEVKALSAQLLRQHNASLESQVQHTALVFLCLSLCAYLCSGVGACVCAYDMMWSAQLP